MKPRLPRLPALQLYLEAASQCLSLTPILTQRHCVPHLGQSISQRHPPECPVRHPFLLEVAEQFLLLALSLASHSHTHPMYVERESGHSEEASTPVTWGGQGFGLGTIARCTKGSGTSIPPSIPLGQVITRTLVCTELCISESH